MAEVITLTSTTLESVINGNKPALILFTNGESVRGDFTTAFKKTAEQQNQIVFARIEHDPQLVEKFSLGSRPVMIGWVNGKEIVRRPRPWGTDVPLAVEMLQNTFKELSSITPVEESKEEKRMTNNNAPVVVTDA